ALPGVGDRRLARLALEGAGVGDREGHAADVVRARAHGRVDDRTHLLGVAHGDVVVVPDVVAVASGLAVAVELLLAPHRQATRADVARLDARLDERLPDGLHHLVDGGHALGDVGVVEVHAQVQDGRVGRAVGGAGSVDGDALRLRGLRAA